MTSRTSNASFRRLASTAALAAVMVVGDGATMRNPQAAACGWDGPEIEDLTTFDPSVAGEPTGPGLQYDPFTAGFGGPCDDCARTAMLADWSGYWAGLVSGADWEKVLFQASATELAELRASLTGAKAAPAGFEAIGRAVTGRPAMRDPVVRALDYVALARRVEQIATVDATAPAATVHKLLADAKASIKTASKVGDAFLLQRLTYQQLRISFYQRNWVGTVAFYDQAAGTLGKPSADLAARARYYAAGALQRSGDRARANLELARVHAGAPALAGVAAQDFQPMEDQDWQATLALATSVRERTELWRLVGVRLDGLVAAQEIFKLDPASDLLGLLVVRELARAERNGTSEWGTPDPSARAAQQKTYVAIERLATAIAAAPGADRPWLMQLVAGHLAARRGDLAAARTRLATAVTGRPGDAKVQAQARASLAVALVQGGTLSAPLADELAHTMTAIDPDFPRRASVTQEVRRILAAAAATDGRVVDAEFLVAGSADAARGAAPGTASRWSDVGFLRQMIARASKRRSAFDRFVLAGAHTRADLEHELALRLLLNSDFAGAAKRLARTPAAATRLGTDPFVTHIVDCHDCDHATYGTAAWTPASFAARLAALHQRARGKGQPAAAAALALGTALYNVTWYGNARIVLDGTHQATRDPQAAARWYQRAFDLSKDREFKAQAAFFAAKAELAGLITAQYGPYDQAEVLPVPTTWYPIVKSFADTRYYRDILAECGAFQRWAAATP